MFYRIFREIFFCFVITMFFLSSGYAQISNSIVAKSVSVKLSDKNKKAVVIPIHGVIDQGLKAFVERATKEASENGAEIIIYEMDTFGGELHSAFDISDIIAGVNKKILTVAYVKTKAISAGALISLSCRKLVMKENTTIGDCAPIIQSQEGPKMLGEKIQSPLRAKFRSLARRNNYPILLAEAMVSDNIEVLQIKTKKGWKIISGTEYKDYNEKEKKKIKSKRTIVEKGKLLTMDANEAVELKFASNIVSGIQQVYDLYDVSLSVTTIEISWSEKLVRFIRKIAPILMLLGLGGIALEIKAPGMVWPAVIGVISLAIVFGGQYLVGLADYWEIVLFVVGVILIIVEVNFIPGFGFFGIAGMLIIVISFVLSFQDFVFPQLDVSWQVEIFKKNIIRVAGVFVGTIVLLLLIGKWFVSSRGVGMLVLNENINKEVNKNSLSVGKLGKTESVLRPSGIAVIDSVRYDVITDGEYLEYGVDIKVVEVNGNKIIVEEIKS